MRGSHVGSPQNDPLRQPRLPQEPRRQRGHARRRRGRPATRTSTSPRTPRSSSSTPAASSARPRRSRSTTIFEMAELKESGACQRLVVAGCLSQRHPDELAARDARGRSLPRIERHARARRRCSRGKAERMLVGNPADWVIRATRPARASPRAARSAYVKIAEGCNRTCSFCVIPQLRGKQRSRTGRRHRARGRRRSPPQGVLRDQPDLARHHRLRPRSPEGRDARRSPTLVRRVADVPGVRWVRLFYLYPETMTDELVELLANHPRVVPYVDMPLQHAADAMLRRMRRGHGGARLRRVVERLRRRDPGPDLPHRVHRRPPGRDRRRVRRAARVRDAGPSSIASAAFRYSDEEGRAEPNDRRQGAREGRRGALSQADGAAAPDLARQEPALVGTGARGAGRRRERRARVRDRWGGTPGKRPRSTGRSICRAARRAPGECAGSRSRRPATTIWSASCSTKQAPTCGGFRPARAPHLRGSRSASCPLPTGSEFHYSPGPAMKQATIRSVCECQSKLEAILDENRHVLVGFAIGSDNERELAPAHSIDAASKRFASAGFATSAAATRSGASTPTASFGATRILRSLQATGRSAGSARPFADRAGCSRCTACRSGRACVPGFGRPSSECGNRGCAQVADVAIEAAQRSSQAGQQPTGPAEDELALLPKRLPQSQKSPRANLGGAVGLGSFRAMSRWFLGLCPRSHRAHRLLG